MFGSLGVPELLLIFAVILIVFGPRRIPEIGRTLGKALGEFRKATDDLKSTIEREVRLEELKKITPPTLEEFTTPFESVSRTAPVESSSPRVDESSSLRVDELASLHTDELPIPPSPLDDSTTRRLGDSPLDGSTTRRLDDSPLDDSPEKA
ncbi:MAG TPA: twin-arginine translocase TatA/TatE family subunit [Thermoanaerobaculia bacterium]